MNLNDMNKLDKNKKLENSDEQQNNNENPDNLPAINLFNRKADPVAKYVKKHQELLTAENEAEETAREAEGTTRTSSN